MDAKTGANIKSGKFVVGDKETTFPIYDGTIGPAVIDIGKFYAETGMFTYDPGYTSTGSCGRRSYIDGDEGILLYRGYPIEQLAEHGDFLETCYLLLYGELPTAAQKADFDNRVTHHTMVHEQMSRFYQGFRRDAHPMAVMTGCVGALSAFYRTHDRHLRSDPADDRLDPHDCKNADDRGDGLQIFDRPALHLSEKRPRLCDEFPAYVLRAMRGTSPMPCSRARWTASSSCTPITSRMPRPRRSGSLVPRAPIPSLASRPAARVCGGRPMEPTSCAEHAGEKSANPNASRNTSAGPKIRTTASA